MMLSAVLIGNQYRKPYRFVHFHVTGVKALWQCRSRNRNRYSHTFDLDLWRNFSQKNLATLYADKLAMAYSGVIAFLMTILTPVIYIVNALSFLLLKLFRIDPNSAAKQMTEKELRTIVDVGHENGIIESEEHEIINNVFDFNDAQAKEIMVPRIDMTMVEVNCSYDDLLAIFRECQYTRLPVYEDTTDNVVGILNIKDLLLLTDTSQFSIRALMREPFFTYEHKNTAELFTK